MMWIIFIQGLLLGSLFYTTYKHGQRIREIELTLTSAETVELQLREQVDLIESEVDVLIERFGQ